MKDFVRFARIFEIYWEFMRFFEVFFQGLGDNFKDFWSIFESKIDTYIFNHSNNNNNNANNDAVLVTCKKHSPSSAGESKMVKSRLRENWWWFSCMCPCPSPLPLCELTATTTHTQKKFKHKISVNEFKYH